MSKEIDINIEHSDVAIEVFEFADLTGHVLVALRDDEDAKQIALTLPEVAAVCQDLREWLAKQGVNDAQIENMALLWREAQVDEPAG